MPEAYYNRIPAMVDPKFSLRSRNKKLWKTVLRFYTEVRNPISHGYQLHDVAAESLQSSFKMFDQIYGWIDSWSDPNRIQRILGSTTFHALK